MHRYIVLSPFRTDDRNKTTLNPGELGGEHFENRVLELFIFARKLTNYVFIILLYFLRICQNIKGLNFGQMGCSLSHILGIFYTFDRNTLLLFISISLIYCQNSYFSRKCKNKLKYINKV